MKKDNSLSGFIKQTPLIRYNAPLIWFFSRTTVEEADLKPDGKGSFIFKLSGFKLNRLNTYQAEVLIKTDGRSYVNTIWGKSPGVSSLKFLPFSEIQEFSEYDEDGNKLYWQSVEKVVYQKNLEDGKVAYDESRADTIVTEGIFLKDDLYAESVINKKGVKYKVDTFRVEFPLKKKQPNIEDTQFMSLALRPYEEYQKKKIQKEGQF